tara:strand:- start:2657 stop:2944 length:288 start_codon:yes stop_codon:yes gene_type:complete
MNKSDKEIQDLKNRISNIEKEKLTNQSKKKEGGASFGFRISTEIVAALFVGVAIGLIVDNYFGSSPFGLIFFFILGAFAGFLNVYRVIRRIEKRD